HARRARLVMVFDEAHEAVLIAEIGAEVQADAFGIALLQPIVQTLVVTEAEAELLQLPLKSPEGFGKEQEIRAGARYWSDRNGPVLGRRTRTGAVAPGPLEDRVQHQHRHIAADPVALVRDLAERLVRRPAMALLESVQLQHIRPRWEVGVAAAGKDGGANL